MCNKVVKCDKGDMMKINWIEFENLETKLKCNRIAFNNDITLLVGLSGAGKSQILDAIITSFNFALHSNSKFHSKNRVRK